MFKFIIGFVLSVMLLSNVSAQQLFHPQVVKSFLVQDGEFVLAVIEKWQYEKLQDDRYHESSRTTFSNEFDTTRWVEIMRVNQTYGTESNVKRKKKCNWKDDIWKCESPYNFSYDQNGRLIKVYSSSQGGISYHSSSTESENYYYNSVGLLYEIVNSTYYPSAGNGPTNWKRRFFYDGDYNLIADTLYGSNMSNFAPQKASSYSYNELGLLSEKRIQKISNSAFVNDQYFVYNYNEDQYLASITRYEFDQAWKPDSITEYFYSGDTLLRVDSSVWDSVLIDWNKQVRLEFVAFIEVENSLAHEIGVDFNLSEGLFFEIYPNPGERMFLSPYDNFSGSFQMDMFDQYGRPVLSEVFTWYDTDKLFGLTDHLPSGLYVVVIGDGEKIQKLKWSKIKSER